MPFYMYKGVLGDNYINKKCAIHHGVPLNRTDLMTIGTDGQVIRPNNYGFFLNNTIPNDGLKKQIMDSYNRVINNPPKNDIVKSSLGKYTEDQPHLTTAGYQERQRLEIIRIQENKLNTLLTQANQREQTLQGHINQLQTQINAITAQMAVATQSINTLIQTAPASAQQNVALQQQLATLQADLANSQNQLQQEQQNITGLQNQLNTLTTNNTQLQTDNQQLTQQNAQLSQNVAQLTQDIANIQQQLANTTNLSQQQIAQLQAELAQKTTELQQTQLVLTQTQAVVQQAHKNKFDTDFLKQNATKQKNILNLIKKEILAGQLEQSDIDFITALKPSEKVSRVETLNRLLDFASYHGMDRVETLLEQELQSQASSSSTPP